MNANANTSPGHGLISIPSRYPFADTVTRLLSAFAQNGIKVFATIDQQKEAAAAGMAMPPTTLILFGNPKAGTPLMLARPESAIDLPLKVLIVAASSGAVSVLFNTTAYLIERHALAPELAANIVPAERLIANAVST